MLCLHTACSCRHFCFVKENLPRKIVLQPLSSEGGSAKCDTAAAPHAAVLSTLYSQCELKAALTDHPPDESAWMGPNMQQLGGQSSFGGCHPDG